jgi:cellulose 1,4-beta-cellobiosidase
MKSPRHRLAWAAVAFGAIAFTGIAGAQTPACQVTYTKSWEGGNGFGANVTIQNNGAAITNGWTLVFNFPNGQRIQNGWPVSFAQPSGSSQVTVSSNADWNKSIGSGASTTVGFNGTFSGANNAPTSFTLNGTACNGGSSSSSSSGGGDTTVPTVSLTSPTSGQSIAVGSPVNLAASASDNVGVARVEFRVDGNLVNSDTTAPYAFSVTGLAAGSHTAQARAYDAAGNLANSSSVSFTVAQTQTQRTITASATTLNVPSTGGTATSVVRLGQAPSGNVVVTLTRSGSSAVTSSPGTITFTTSNWSSGVTVTFTVASGTAAATSTFALAATNYTGTSITVNRQAGSSSSSSGGRADNPYSGAGVYNNPIWRANAVAGGGSAIANQPTGVWMDRISAIAGNNSGSTGAWGLVQHLNEAVSQDAANGSTPLVFQLVIYNLPGRDCAALASNGELGQTEIGRYRTEYIDVIAEILGRSAYSNLRIATIIEIDSLPNLVTNTTDRVTGTVQCDAMKANGNYVNGVGYALAKLGAIPNVYNYVDAGHHGWLGWDTNFNPSVQIMLQAANASGATPANVVGFITNTANTSALQEPYITVDSTTRPSRWIDWNQFNDELSYAQAFRNAAVAAGFPSNIGMLIDTSRNGWGGPNRPTGPSTLSDLNARIDASRIDRRIHKGNWCNPSGAGIGERPRAAPASGVDAYVWIKPPGESDGSSSAIPNDEGKGFDRMCDPTYGGNPRNNNSQTGALPNAPISGHWFQSQFTQLLQNAYPPL